MDAARPHDLPIGADVERFAASWLAARGAMSPWQATARAPTR